MKFFRRSLSGKLGEELIKNLALLVVVQYLINHFDYIYFEALIGDGVIIVDMMSVDFFWVVFSFIF